MKMTERLKRVAADIGQYQVTIDDPVTYPRAFTISMPPTPLDGGGCSRTTVTRGTWRSASHRAPSARRTRRWRPTSPRASNANVAIG
jgi:hypothetical protein